VRGGAAIDAQAIGLARLLGVHVSACLEMVMATTAARELAMLEMSSPAVPDEAPLPPAPAAGPRFDVLRSLSAMLTGARSETAIAHVEEASIAESRTREREPAEHVSDRIGVVCDELARDVIARCYRRPPSPPRSRGRPLSRADRSAG